jgi:CheY-like chemotaxis protein
MEKRIKILIADDDSDERDFIREGFEQSGLFDVIDIVPNGNELINVVKSLKEEDLPELILSDLNMPLFNGCEAMQELKNDPKYMNILFIIVSTSETQDTHDHCLNAGAFAIHLKPASFFEYKAFAKNLYNEVISSLLA